MKRDAIEAVTYGCIRDLDGRISDCKLGMNAKCFHDKQISIILDPCRRQPTENNGLDRLKNCCNHSVRDVYAITDGAWRKKKKYFQQIETGNFPDECIIYIKSFSVGCVSY